ncbi:MAG: hypothetical protein RLP14_09050 [Owenweeksia sp.]|jgi:hypothetical protein
MSEQTKKAIRKRARQIRKAGRPKATLKDYLQIALVILVILAIFIAAFVLTSG